MRLRTIPSASRAARLSLSLSLLSSPPAVSEVSRQTGAVLIVRAELAVRTS
ncbi:hypothetical protein PZA11_006654 [Diplocarpon coronariae]